MDTRSRHRTLSTLLATCLATSALAGARPVLVVDAIPAVAAGTRYAFGLEISVFGSRVRADVFATGFRIVCRVAGDSPRTSA